MKPLSNIRIERKAPAHIRVYADVYSAKDKRCWPMYADKQLHLFRENDEEKLFREALHACFDLLGFMYGDGDGKPHGPWQKIYWAYQGDIRRQINKALS